jgi:hypothetical protein
MIYKIKIMKKDILYEISQYLNLIFSNDYFNKDYLYWKYFDNPAGKSIILGAYDKEKIVGFRALVPAVFKINNKIEVLYQFCESSTHKDYRGKHIFSDLTERAMKISGKDIFCHFPNSNSLPAYKKSFGTIKIDELKYLTSFTGCLNFKSIIIDKIEKHQFYIFSYEKNIYQQIDQNMAFLEINNLQEFSITDEKIIAKRGFEFIKWRFIEHPKNKYIFLIIKTKEKIFGYVILHKRNYGKLRLLTIVDIFINDKSINESKLVSCALKFAKNIKEPFIIFPKQKSKIRKINIIDNIIMIPKKHITLAITFKDSKNIEREFYLDPSNWQIMPSDIDTF